MFRNLTILALCIAALLCGWRACSRNRNTITVASASPDARRRLLLIDLDNFDRNFIIRLDNIDGDRVRSQTIFESPDEGRPTGTERFIWSNSGRYALLVGRHFFVTEQFRLASGESLYLLIDTATGTILGCNSNQSSRRKAFSLSDLSHFADSWPEDAALRPTVDMQSPVKSKSPSTLPR